MEEREIIISIRKEADKNIYKYERRRSL